MDTLKGPGPFTVFAPTDGADVTKLKEAKTVEGQMVKIDASDGVRINGANVVKADVEASNGVIHVIDSVILPQ